VIESFTEDRIKVGISLGFVGPEIFMDDN